VYLIHPAQVSTKRVIRVKSRMIVLVIVEKKTHMYIFDYNSE
jgi:hypothetical protein